MESNNRILKTIILLLAVSLLLNIFTFVKMNDLQKLIDKQNINMNQMFNQNLAQLQSRFNEVEEQNSWISPVSFKVGDDSADSRGLELSWQIKEYPVGAQVTLYYRLNRNNEFTALIPQSTRGGNFKAEIQVPIIYEPEWSVHYLGEAENNSQPPSAVKEMLSFEASENDILYYCVSMENNGKILTSEQKSTNISKLTQGTAPISVSVYQKKEQYTITLVEDYHLKPKVSIQEAILKVYRDENMIEEISFKTKTDLDEKDTSMFEAVWDSDQDITPKFFVEVTYSNNKTIKKGI